MVLFCEDDDAEPDSPEWQALEAFTSALMRGKVDEAALALPGACGFQIRALELFAELLDGELSPNLFPWKFEIRKRHRGRPSQKSLDNTELIEALSTGNQSAFAMFLRKTSVLAAAELAQLVETIVGLLSSESTYPWRFVAVHRSRGKPVDVVEKSNRIFPARNIAHLVAERLPQENKIDSAVDAVSKMLKISKSTIYKMLAEARAAEKISKSRKTLND